MENKKNDEELAQKLAEQEEILRALRNEEVDAVVGTKNVIFLRLKETEDELKKQRRHLEELLAERTKLLEELKIHQGELKSQAEELRRGHDELEFRVRERTAELECRNRELQAFAYVASHDLSEPLRKIQTFGSLLEVKSADLMDEQSRDYVSRMTGSANRMQELLDAVLRYSQVEVKGNKFGPAKLDDVIRDSLTELEIPIRNAKAHVEIGSLPTVNGDPHQLRQLFQNLIGNSLKYYRSEVKPLVRVYGEGNNDVCRIFVEDNGIGFDEKYLEKIFQPFQRLHGRNEYSGTGIGLAICRKIVERHGGTITAKSAPGKGSTFIVTLPIEKEK